MNDSGFQISKNGDVVGLVIQNEPAVPSAMGLVDDGKDAIRLRVTHKAICSLAIDFAKVALAIDNCRWWRFGLRF